MDTANGRIHIVGRQPGLLGWLFSNMGVDATTELMVSPQAVHFRAASLFGALTTVCPIRRVSSMQCGHAKPVQYLRTLAA